MPGIRFNRLVDAFIGNLERLGATVFRESRIDSDRPARFRVVSSDGTNDCILYLWTITPGGGRGGERPANERRIQLTNVRRIVLEPGKRTLLGGWSDDAGVWCFWDARRHTRFSGDSPSIQVSMPTLDQASRAGLATYVRPALAGQEVVVAVHSDSLLWYVQEGAMLHNAEGDASGVEMLVDVTPEDERQFIDASADENQTGRRYDLVETMRAYREARFRPAVLRAYSYRCAVCQCALKLIDAAHIIPVSRPESTDDVTNGIALCRLHHGAYDNGLLGVRSDYRVILNTEQAQHLADLQLDMGLNEFRERLPELITVPSVREVRPDPRKLILGLQSRRWPSALVE